MDATSITVRAIKNQRSFSPKPDGRADRKYTNTISKPVVAHPRRNIVWNSGNSVRSDFIKVSLTVNAVMDAIIISAPRALSERVTMAFDSKSSCAPLLIFTNKKGPHLGAFFLILFTGLIRRLHLRQRQRQRRRPSQVRPKQQRPQPLHGARQ